MKSEKFALYSIIAIILIIGSVLRIYNLGEKSLDVDELVSVTDSENPMGSAHPPLSFFIIHLFTYVGTSDFVLRLPALIFGVLTILLSFMIGRMLFGIKEGLICAFLMSISTMHVYYSQLVRMYSPLVFFTLLSLFFFYKCFVEKNNNVNWKKNWIGFILSTVLSLYTHYFAVFIVLVEITFFCLLLIGNRFLTKETGKIDKRVFLLFFSGFSLILVLYLPQLLPQILSLRVGGSGITNSPSPTPLELSYLFGESGVFRWFSNFNPYVLYLFLSFFLIGIVLSVWKFKESIILLLLWVTLPMGLLFLLSTIRTVLPVPRYLIFVLPIYLLIISKGIVGIAEIIFERGKEK